MFFVLYNYCSSDGSSWSNVLLKVLNTKEEAIDFVKSDFMRENNLRDVEVHQDPVTNVYEFCYKTMDDEMYYDTSTFYSIKSLDEIKKVFGN